MRGLCVPATVPRTQVRSAPVSSCHGFFLHPYFFHPFSNGFLDGFLVRFASQLASQNPLKCVKNRCQDAFHLGLHVWIDFWSMFAPNLDLNTINHC